MASQAISDYKRALSGEMIERVVMSALVSAAVSVIMLSSAKAILLNAALFATATLVDSLVRPFFAEFICSSSYREAITGNLLCTFIAVISVEALKHPAAYALGVIAPKLSITRFLSIMVWNCLTQPARRLGLD